MILETLNTWEFWLGFSTTSTLWLLLMVNRRKFDSRNGLKCEKRGYHETEADSVWYKCRDCGFRPAGYYKNRKVAQWVVRERKPCKCRYQDYLPKQLRERQEKCKWCGGYVL